MDPGTLQLPATPSQLKPQPVISAREVSIVVMLEVLVEELDNNVAPVAAILAVLVVQQPSAAVGEVNSHVLSPNLIPSWALSK